MSTISLDLSGASQLAIRLAAQAKPGFSTDPGDYQPARVQMSGSAFNPGSKYFRSDLDPLDFLVGDIAIKKEGVPVVILGSLSGFEERDRVIENGKQTTRRFALWTRQPDVTPVKGSGGGLKTDRGGWISGKFDEIFLLTPHGLGVLTTYDQHHVVADLQQQALHLGVDAMFEIKWALTKLPPPVDVAYAKSEPHFEPLGVVGEANGPSEAEIAQAKKLSVLIAQLHYANPSIPLKLVVGGNSPEPFEEPPAADPDDPGPADGYVPDSLPDWMR